MVFLQNHHIDIIFQIINKNHQKHITLPMRKNHSVTQKAIHIPDNYILSSTTDLNGKITSVTDDFIKVSGYSREEMVGQPHNIIRHPDVPSSIFEDLWSTLQTGQTWGAIVKNRAKSGDHYWVEANTSPIIHQGKTIGYISVRNPASTEQIAAAEQLYQDVAAGKLILEGGIPKTPLQKRLDRLNPLRKSSLKTIGILLVTTLLISGSISIFTAWEMNKNVSEVQSSWNHFQDINSERSRTLNTLLANIGYGGMIHQFKNYLIRKSLPRVAKIDRKATAALFALDHYRQLDLSTEEQEAVVSIRSIISAYKGAAQTAQRMVNAGSSAEEIDQVIQIDDKPALNGIATLKQVIQSRQRISMQEKPGVLSALRESLGYGGMIHHFKNYILRQDTSHITKMKQSIGNARTLLQAYRAFNLSNREHSSLDEIETMINHYSEAFELAIQLAQQQLSPEQIDQKIKVNDRPAIKGLSVLTTEIEHQLAEESKIVNQKMETSLFWSSLSIKLNTALYLLMVLLFIWALSFKIIRPVRVLQQIMRSIREDGRFNLRARMENTGDEISLMANDFDQLLGNIQRSVTSVNDVMASMSQGRFDARITDSLFGDLSILKQGVNNSAENVETMVMELSRIMKAMHNGDFSVEIRTDFEGEFLQMAETTKETMNTLNTIIAGITQVMGNIEQGRFQHRVEVEAFGDLDQLKNQINSSTTALEAAMKDITRVVSAQAEGDMTKTITADYHGELRILKEAVNTTASKLHTVVSDVIDSSHSVSNTASQVAQGSGALSQRTQEQAATLEETAGSMEEMTSTVQQNTDAAQLANQLATEVRNEAENSSTVVHKAIEAMEKITDSSQKIAEIITLIDGIAFQTNLLALNAAVEAARAGEHGRGFAVVANEVRSLAQKSAEASKEVKELIEGSVSRVKEGGRHVSATGTALEKMNQSIKKVSDLISEIAVASTEQQTGINQVSSSIAGMDRVTQENAAAVEETNAAADQMANLARHMRQLMAFFNTSERLY